MERWLHQHIFKVGWLLTRNFNVTTVLYYTLFLPGILLHEVVSWLVAGILNVYAAQAIAWPQSQEIGELKLNFVRIATSIPAWKRFVITIAPLIVGMLVTWHVANNVFELEKVFALMSSGALVDVSAAFNRLFATPDFWLWFYLLFTISNTMFANLAREMKNLQTLMATAAAISVSIGIVSATTATLSTASDPLERALVVLMELLIMMISVNFLTILLLGTIESAIERFTNNSATFRKGRMITMTREEMLAERSRERERIHNKTLKATRNPAVDGGIVSIYKMAFPIPGAPNRDMGSQLQLEVETSAAVRKPVIAAPVTRPATESMPKVATPPAVATPTPSLMLTPTDNERPLDKPVAPVRPSASPFGNAASRPAATVKPSTEKEDDEPDEKPALPARPSVSSFGNAVVSPAATVKSSAEKEDDEPDAKPTLPARPSASPFGNATFSPAATVKPSAEKEDEEPDEEPALPARFTPSPFGNAAVSPAATVKSSAEKEDDEPDEKPTMPARFTPSPFGKPTPSPVSTSSALKVSVPVRPSASLSGNPTSRVTDSNLFSDEELPDPFSENKASKPAGPKNEVYNRLSSTPAPLSQPISVPKPGASNTIPKAAARPLDDDIDGIAYDPDEDVYTDEDEDDSYASDDE